MKKRFVFLVLALVLTISPAIANEHLKWFGPCCPGEENIPRVAEFSNLVTIEQPLGISTIAEIAQMDIDEILEASQCGAKSLVMCFNIFFEYDEEDRIISLRSDYSDRWQQFANALKPYEQHIWGMLTLDEPLLTGLRQGWRVEDTLDMINEINSLIKKAFPAVSTVGALRIIKSDLSWSEGKYLWGAYVPPGSYEEWDIPTYDIVGTFYYYAIENRPLDEFKAVCEGRFNELRYSLLPEQKMVLIPGAFCVEGQVCDETALLNLADWYYSLAQWHPFVVGIVPFLYQSVNNLIGVDQLPRVLEKWQDIGIEITKTVSIIQCEGVEYQIRNDNSMWHGNNQFGYVIDTGEGHAVYDINGTYKGTLLGNGYFLFMNGNYYPYTYVVSTIRCEGVKYQIRNDDSMWRGDNQFGYVIDTNEGHDVYDTSDVWKGTLLGNGYFFFMDGNYYLYTHREYTAT